MIACGSLPVVIDTLALGVVIVDGQFQVAHWNRWLADRSRISAATAYGQNLFALFPEASGSRLAEALAYALEKGLPSLLSPVFHGNLLPLHTVEGAAKRLQQMTHVLPLSLDGKRYALIQIADMTAAVSRERRLREEAVALRQGRCAAAAG